MNLQEANLRSVKVNSDDPLHSSTRLDESLPSFVAVQATSEAMAGRDVDVAERPTGNVEVRGGVDASTKA